MRSRRLSRFRAVSFAGTALWTLAGGPGWAGAEESPAWTARRQEWLAARSARSEARWTGTSEAIEAASRKADRAESLYVNALEGWAIALGAAGAGQARTFVPRSALAALPEAALDLLDHKKPEAALAILNGPLRDDPRMLPVRAGLNGLRVAPDSGLALLDWPPDRRAAGGQRLRWESIGRRAPDEADAAYLVSASLAESTGTNRAVRAALWRLARHRDTRQAYARLKLARALARGGEHRLAAEILAGAVLHDDDEKLLLAELRSDIRLELADTTGAAALMAGVTRDAGYGAAQRVAASRQALPLLQGARVDSLAEADWLQFVRSLGDLGETETALGVFRRRRAAAPDSAALLARAEVEAALYARAKRHGEAAAAYEKLLRRTTLPSQKRAGYALGVARAKRGMGNFAGCDSAFLAAVALDSLGATGSTAAWERAREWEDRRDAREAARVFQWSRRFLRDPTVVRSRTIHAALAWWRAGEPDSALETFEDSTAEFAIFWRSRILVSRGDSTGAVRELGRLRGGESWTYEGVRAAEELARIGPAAASAPSGAGSAAGAEKAKSKGTVAGPPPPSGATISARVFGAIGGIPWMMDELRECAGAAGPRGRACTEELEARGVFRVGRSANVPADRLDYPPAYPEAVLDAARREGLSPALVWAIMRQESAYLRGVRSRAGAIGLLQLLPSTASRLAGTAVTEQDLYDSDRNVRLGARYLRALLAEFGDARAATAAYNAGEEAARRWVREFGPVDDFWVERIPYRETRDYVRQVYTIWKRYERMYGAPGGVGNR